MKISSFNERGQEMVKDKFLFWGIILAVASMCCAQVTIYEENFDDGTYNTDYWNVISGGITADGTQVDGGVFFGDDPQDAFGSLSFGTAGGTQVGFDLYKLVVTDLGYDPNDLGKVTISFDLAQTNGTAAGYRFTAGYTNDAEVKIIECSPEGGVRGDPMSSDPTGWRNNQTSFLSRDGTGGPVNDPSGNGVELANRLNQGQWEWQRMKFTFDVDEYFTTKLFQDYNQDGQYNYVAYYENWHPSSGIDPWPAVDSFLIVLPDGVVSWFIDNLVITLDDPYLGWTEVLNETFDDGDFAGWTTGGIPTAYWTVDGAVEPSAAGGTDPLAAWGALPGKMASADPNAWFKTNIPATTPGDLVAISVEVQQLNGTDGDFPVFLGLGDGESDDYYVEYASPALTYGSVSGAMTMMQDDPQGNGSNPFLVESENWWSFGAGQPGKKLSTGISHLDLVFNPWEDYPNGSISFYIDGELAAKWTNFRSLFSFDEVFFGIRKNIYEQSIDSNVPCWNFDDIKVYTRGPKCGDAGYNQYDFNQNCVVDLPDFVPFAANWLECTDPLDLSCFN